VLPPDVNESQLHFSVEKGKGVRFGLTAIKGLGDGAINALLDARRELGGRIPSLHALCEILDMRVANKRVFEALVKSGACDSLAPPTLASRPLQDARARLFAAIDAACEHGSRTQRDKELGQTDLFGADAGGAGSSANVPLPDVAAWTEIELLNFEKETLGLYLTGHPVDRWADDLREYGAKSIADLGLKKEPGAEDHADAAADANGNGPSRVVEEISIGGIVASVRPLKTRKGDRMSVFMLEDKDGSLEIVVFPETFKLHGHLCESGRMVLVKGKFERDDESARLVASEILPIELVSERLAKKVAITVSTPPHDRETFLKLWDVIAAHKGDRPVALTLVDTERHLRVKLDVAPQIKVRPSERLVAEVEKICGNGSVTLR
jgi:DNA polymerase-3 subunit alpha